MGQFYKGTGADFLDDAMFKLPYEMIAKVIDKKDKDVDDAVTSNNEIAALLKAQAMKIDDPALRKL